MKTKTINLTKKKLIKRLKAIALSYSTECHFKKLKPETAGYANCDGTFFVCSTLTKLQMMNTFFHELAHELNAKDGKFAFYHNNKNWTDENRKKLIKTAWRAEVYTDKRGMKLQKEWFPNMHYERSYVTDEEKEWLAEYIKNETLKENY